MRRCKSRTVGNLSNCYLPSDLIASVSRFRTRSIDSDANDDVPRPFAKIGWLLPKSVIVPAPGVSNDGSEVGALRRPA